MTAIYGWTRLLRSGTLTSNDLRGAGDHRANVHSELRLINDILDATQIAATGDLKIQRQPLALLPLLNPPRICCSAGRAEIHCFDTDFNLEGCELLADADRLKQVIWNLLRMPLNSRRRQIDTAPLPSSESEVKCRFPIQARHQS